MASRRRGTHGETCAECIGQQQRADARTARLQGICHCGEELSACWSCAAQVCAHCHPELQRRDPDEPRGVAVFCASCVEGDLQPEGKVFARVFGEGQLMRLAAEHAEVVRGQRPGTAAGLCASDLGLGAGAQWPEVLQVEGALFGAVRVQLSSGGELQSVEYRSVEGASLVLFND